MFEVRRRSKQEQLNAAEMSYSGIQVPPKINQGFIKTSLLVTNAAVAPLSVLKHLGRRSASPDSGYRSPSTNSEELADVYTVAVEGNIGVGKSTFLEFFRGNSDVEVHPEPVAKWKNLHGFNALDMMYKDPRRWSMTFQSYVQLTMLQLHTLKQEAPVRLMERSLYSARFCFVENLYRSGKLHEFDYLVLDEWYNWMMSTHNVHVDLLVYLRSSPEVCLERIKKRSRSEEESVPLEYLKSLHDLYEELLSERKFINPKTQVLVIDANKGMADFQKEVEEQRPRILFNL